jgi:hypothetical protein
LGNRKEGIVPQIIVTADQAQDQDPDGVMLRERVNVEDFESERFAANLVERLGWAVIDAAEVERSPDAVGRTQTEPVNA